MCVCVPWCVPGAIGTCYDCASANACVVLGVEFDGGVLTGHFVLDDGSI